MPAESRIGVGQPDTGKMRTDSLLSPDAYRDLLTRAGVPAVDIARSASALPITTTHTSGAEQTITAVRLSKGLCLCAEQARASGVKEEEIARIIEKARAAAAGEHRTKAGLFGKAGEVIGELRDKISEGHRRAAFKE